jgi:ubiquinone/menaquinone biosynthesis C-methylase UbiE
MKKLFYCPKSISKIKRGKRETHEMVVENFYSTGSKIKNYISDTEIQRNREFLSFGYWENNTKTYLDAADNLLQFFIENSDIKNASKILNVACGYGTETFAFYNVFKPAMILGIDITKQHVEYANEKARVLKLEKKIKFYHADACILDFPDNSFSHILGIEGPAHFNSREKFFNSAYRVLNKNGELLLTDIIGVKEFKTKKGFQKYIMNFSGKKWHIPKANWVDENSYKQQLNHAGLKVIFLQLIGDKVFPGYANNAFSFRTIKTRIGQRGIFGTIGLTIISYLLNYLYKKGIIEYIYVKAQK